MTMQEELVEILRSAPLLVPDNMSIVARSYLASNCPAFATYLKLASAWAPKAKALLERADAEGRKTMTMSLMICENCGILVTPLSLRCDCIKGGGSTQRLRRLTRDEWACVQDEPPNESDVHAEIAGDRNG